MTHPAIPAPAPDEYAPFYAGYIASVAGADVRAVLERQIPALAAACAALPEDGALHRYAAGKWSIKEVIGHLADSERIFSYRALRTARGDATPLPGFDENAYVAAAGFDVRPLGELLEELRRVRASTLALLDGVDPRDWERRGTANGAEVSLRALAHIIAGHTAHHLRVLGERYGLPVSTAAQPA